MVYRNPVELRAGDFYVQKMQSAFLPRHRVLTIENATRLEQEIWEEIQLDAGFRHAIDFSRKLIVGKDWRIEAFDSTKKNRDIAAIYTRLLRKTKFFRRWLFAISEFAIRGESYGFPNFTSEHIDVLGDGNAYPWVFPEEIKHIDRYRIKKIVREDYNLDYQIHSLSERTWKFLEDDQVEALIYFNNSAEEGRFTFGNGLIESLYWCWYCKKIIEGELLNLSERFGQGMLIAKIENLKLGSKNKKLQEYAEELIALLGTFKARHVGFCGKEEDIQVVEPAGTGYTILKELLDYYDSKFLALCLGANLSVESVQTGSYTQSIVHQDSTFQYIGYERSIIEEGVEQSLFQNIWKFNQEGFRRLGLASGEPPRFKIIGHKNDTPQTNLEILRGALNDLKLPIMKSEAYQMLGLTQGIELDPETGDEGDDLIYPDRYEALTNQPISSPEPKDSGGQPEPSESLPGEPAAETLPV